MGFGHRVYRAEDPRARVLRRTAKELGAPRYEVALALEKAALAELRSRRPDRVLETNVEFWAAIVLDFAQRPADMFTLHVHLRADGGLGGAHHGAEAHRPARPAGRQVHRPAAPADQRRPRRREVLDRSALGPRKSCSRRALPASLAAAVKLRQ